MAASTTLLQFLLIVVAGWLHRQQGAVIEYLHAENRLLRERLGGRRRNVTKAERRALATAARAWHNRDARNTITLAPRTGGAQVDLHRASPTGSAAHPQGIGGTGRADGEGEPRLGLHTYPGGDGQPRPRAGPRNDSQDPERLRDRTGPDTRQGNALVG